MLVLGIITGAIGTAYFIYGTKNRLAIPMLSGVGLCIYPYMVDNIWMACSIGLALILAPFYWKF